MQIFIERKENGELDPNNVFSKASHAPRCLLKLAMIHEKKKNNFTKLV